MCCPRQCSWDWIEVVIEDDFGFVAVTKMEPKSSISKAPAEKG